MTLVERYIDGWRAHDADAILATLDPSCVIIESYGPIYRGHGWVARWIQAWQAEEGCVIGWEIHSLNSSADQEVAEWTFHYTCRGEEKRFDGTTIARLRDGKITYLREYATTATLFEWEGKWQ